MADFMCPSLGRLGMLLKAAYRRRDICTADNKDIREAELNLRRIHNLITRHRSSCPRCRFDEGLKRIPPKNDNPKSEVIPISRAS
jgi:hypothetical protein